ncbi:putative T7SS-secreted protein [Streptomyces sioyaensis]|uniref:putative T7SS-secreted protein n=1 Tax=Streptomyces sioyaensis TaxID=67364 RepID=UPI0033D4A703
MATGKGRRRPVDWHPLAAKDPIPGDPEDIRDEVRKMKDTASTLRDQARILRKAADGDALQGKYADKIREKSGDLEKHFRETAGRYERVVGDLHNWANDLDGFQERADGILKSAKHADEHHAAEVKKNEAEAKRHGKDDGDKKQSEESDPDSHLAPYHKQLNEVISDRDSRAQHYANNIGNDIKDVIKDSSWEDFKDWVHANADTIDTVCEVLSWAATIIGVLALVFTPVGWIATLITVATVGLTALVGVGHAMLAASGDGAWTDVAMDVFALATLGFAPMALRGVKTATQTLKATSRGARFGRYANLRKLLNKNVMRYGLNSERGAKASRGLKNLREIGAKETRPTTTRMGRLLGGDEEVVSATRFARRMRAEFSGNAAIGDSADAVHKAARWSKGIYGAATGVDLGDKFVGIALGDTYDGAKDSLDNGVKDVLTRESGSTWQPAPGAR